MALGVRLGGRALVCCIHGITKRERLEVEFDARTMKPLPCNCCQNIFLVPVGVEPEPLLCPLCAPKGLIT